MTTLQTQLIRVKTLLDLGIEVSPQLTVYYADEVQAARFIETFGLTKQYVVNGEDGVFLSVHVGPHIRIFIDGRIEFFDAKPAEELHPVYAVCLAYAFFGPKQVGPFDTALDISLHHCDAETAAKIIQALDAPVECREHDTHRWLNVGGISIFFKKPSGV